MKITTILVNDMPKAVVRPVDTKDLRRFLKNARSYLNAGDSDAVITHRDADEQEVARWTAALELHTAWGGERENYFGIPL